MNHRVVDGTGASVEPHTCIFPILKEVGDGEAHLVGTGFFITTIGNFVTAKHVIFDAFDPHTGRQRASLHAVHFVEGSAALVRHITRVSFHNTADLTVGKMDFHVINATGQPLMNRVPVFTLQAPHPSAPAVTYAYPESDASFRSGSSAAFRPNFYSGEVLAHSAVARDQALVSWSHYCTSITVLGGASGGPVFDERGRVFGVNCVGGLQGLSYMGCVADLLPLTVHDFPPKVPDGPEPTVLNLARSRQVLFEPPLT